MKENFGSKQNKHQEMSLVSKPKESYVMDDLAQHCRDLYTEYKNSTYRKNKMDEINEGRKRYKADLPPKTFPWDGCSNKSLCLEAIAVDNLEPRIKSQLISTDDFVEVEPVGEEDIENAESVKEFIHWALNNNMHIEETIKPFIHDLLLNGTQDILPIWQEKRVKSKVRAVKPIFVNMEGDNIDVPPEVLQNPAEMQKLMATGAKQIGMEDTFNETDDTAFKVDLKLLRLSDCFFPDTGDDFTKQPFLRLIYPTLFELKKMSGENGPYKNITDDLLLIGSRTILDDGDDDEDEKDVRHSEYTKEVKLLECYVEWKGVWTLVTYAIDRAWREVRRQPISDIYWHSRKPVIRFKIYPESNESMGTGIPMKIQHFSKGIDDLYNQMIDSATIEILPFMFIPESPGSESIDLKLSPGIMVPIPKDSHPFVPNFGVKSPQFVTFINLLLSFFERTMSLSDFSTGRPSENSAKGGETFSGMSAIIQEGNIKHAYMGQSLQDQFANLLNDIRTLYAQYMPFDAKKRVFENNKWTFQPLDALAIQGNYDFRVHVANSSSNKMLNRRERVELMNMMAKNPTINLMTLTEDVLKAYDAKPIRDYIKPEFPMMLGALEAAPELPKVIEQYMQQKQQQDQTKEYQQQAVANLERQSIQREAEKPVEDEKLHDQAVESIKRTLIKDKLEAETGITEMKEVEKLEKEKKKAQEKQLKEITTAQKKKEVRAE